MRLGREGSCGLLDLLVHVEPGHVALKLDRDPSEVVQLGEGFSVQAGITNLLDERYYRRFVSGIYPGAPRQFFVSAGWTFAF